MKIERNITMIPPDPVPALISDILAMEGMHPDTALLIRLALEAQESGVKDGSGGAA